MRGLLRLHHKKKEEKIFIDLIRTVKKQITRTNNLLINLISQRLLVQSWFAMKPLSNDGNTVRNWSTVVFWGEFVMVFDRTR
jgi:hypothetical protein